MYYDSRFKIIADHIHDRYKGEYPYLDILVKPCEFADSIYIRFAHHGCAIERFVSSCACISDIFKVTDQMIDELRKTVKKREVDYTSYFHAARKYMLDLEIEDVIFNGPATIVKWKDGTKTIVKAQEDKTCGMLEPVDYEKGLAMAIAKKALGNKGNYYNTFKKYLKED